MTKVHLTIPIGIAVLALVFAFIKFRSIMKRDEGSEEMQDIAKRIQEGAFAFLKAEYTWLVVFAAVVFAAIAL